VIQLGVNTANKRQIVLIKLFYPKLVTKK